MLIHRIPSNVVSEDLMSVLPGDFTIEVKVCIVHILPFLSCFLALIATMV